MKLRHVLQLAILVASPVQEALAHGSEQPPHQIADLGKFTFEDGSNIDNLRMSYVTHGKLNAGKDNAVLLLHGFGANHHLFDHLVGPGEAFDTNRYFVIVSDSLGSTQTGFEHSTSPTTSGLKMEFPAYNLRDAVHAEHKLVSEQLRIERLIAVSGISMGGEKTLHYAVIYPDFMRGALPIVGSASQWSSQGFLTFGQYFRILETCAGWDGGNYETNPRECAAAALGALVPSFYTREWWNENITSNAAFQEWQQAWYAGYLGVQDARDLYHLGQAVSRTAVGDAPGFGGDLKAALGSVVAKTLYIVNRHDQFVPPEYVEAQASMIPNARVLWVESNAGHLICCGADPDATWVMTHAIRGFLHGLADD